MAFVTNGETARTPMPETPVKFVDGVGTGIETVDMEVSARDAILAGITGYVEGSAVVGHTRLTIPGPPWSS